MRKDVKNIKNVWRRKIIETEFPQEEAVINLGEPQVSTYNLVNCIAIGGIFELTDGTFLTHESV